MSESCADLDAKRSIPHVPLGPSSTDPPPHRTPPRHSTAPAPPFVVVWLCIAPRSLLDNAPVSGCQRYAD